MTDTKLDPRLTRLSPEVKRMVMLLGEARNGDRRAQRVLREAALDPMFAREALSTSDFPALFQRSVNAQALARYTQTPQLWPKWAKRTTVKGLRKQDFYDLFSDLSNLPKENGGVPTLPGGLPRIPEGTPFPAIAFGSSTASIWTYKHGARVAFTWEAFDNDDWQLIGQLPDELNRAAVRTEDLSATSVLMGATGWNTAVFGTADTVPLSWANLDAALAKVKSNPASDPERVNVITKWALIVPRELAQVAQAIVNTTQVEVTDGQGNKLVRNNAMGDVEVVENPFLSRFWTGTGSAKAATSWALVPFGGEGSDRASIVEVFKQGQETPELRIKNDQGQALGGGNLDPYEGSFDTDDIQVRVRHFVNTMAVDTSLGFYASNGQ